MKDNSQKKRSGSRFRTSARKLSLFYDVLTFVILFFALFVVYYGNAGKALTSPVLLVYGVLSFTMIFGMRFLLRIYHLIVRYGNVGIYLRILQADLVSGALYFGITAIIPKAYDRVPYWLSGTLVGAMFLIGVLSRLLYVALFRAAQKENAFGRFARRILRFFAAVDPKDEADGRDAEILPFNRGLFPEDAKKLSPINEVQRVARQFQINGDITGIMQINKGYINRTYHVTTLSVHNHVHHYTLQRVNTNVFPDIDGLMENFDFVTKHLHEKLLLPGHTERGSVQTLKPTKDGKTYYRDDSGCWRMLTHFTGVYGMDTADSPETFYQAGKSFGLFIRCMADVPAEKLHIVIPNYHNTASRYLDLEKAIAEDPVHRLRDVWDEVEFVRQRKDRFGLITDALDSGRIPTRIMHGDCNLNNILFSEETHEPVAIIDLDTVMPGSPLYDYGDSMRVGTNTAKDDETDLSKVSCDLNLYEHYARGYLESCGDMLTKEELELLPFASMIITAEDGIRFLSDHINGDVYYNVFYPNQNLDRARTQLKLLEDMEKKEQEIRSILKRIYDDLGLDADPFRIQFE